MDLDGWRVGDGNEVDALVARDQNTLLSPCGCALLLDSSYFHNSDSYQPLPADVIVLAIEDATFGKGGFQNEGAERVLLVTAVGDTVGSALYVLGNPEGFSEENIDPSGVAYEKNWSDSRWKGGTPGRVNSVSPKNRDLSLDAVTTSPILVASGENGHVIRGKRS